MNQTVTETAVQNGALPMPPQAANLATIEQSAAPMVVRSAQPSYLEFSPDQRKMIRDSYANGATEAEFEVLIEVSRVRRLNPLLRQIHFVKRWNKKERCDVWSAQVSIDGLRCIAQRTGESDGQDEPEFLYSKPKEGQKRRLLGCKVRVYRKGISRPFVGVALVAEYKDDRSHFWTQKPHIMIAKCAEALGIRKGFPEDTSGLYIPEEMGDEEESAQREDRREPERRTADGTQFTADGEIVVEPKHEQLEPKNERIEINRFKDKIDDIRCKGDEQDIVKDILRSDLSDKAKGELGVYLRQFKEENKRRSNSEEPPQ